jgi:hypothetical protein
MGLIDVSNLYPALPFLEYFGKEYLNGNYLYPNPLNVSSLVHTKVTEFGLNCYDGWLEILIA